jgi:hypothetical protein
MNILTVNLVLSTLVFGTVCWIYVVPKMSKLEPRTILVPILLLHSMRHLGLMFLAPGATYPGLPPQFAYPAAFGDLLTAFLAMISVFAIILNIPRALLFVWTFNIVGSLDLLSAIVLATSFGAAAYMGAAYWIPAFWVPTLLVTHFLTFVVLLRKRK